MKIESKVSLFNTVLVLQFGAEPVDTNMSCSNNRVRRDEIGTICCSLKLLFLVE